ncbi:MAG: hypothetical protein HYX53_04485 [Chloroflexi bacterium]|nr:hypothetical protein [Chloroflexota bacterium]
MAEKGIIVRGIRGLIARVLAESEHEDGHGVPLLGALIAGIGTIALGIGAANDTGWLSVTGGIVAFVGTVAMLVLSHLTIDYDIYRRIETLEGKNK